MPRRRVPKENPAAWAEEPLGRAILIALVAIGVIVMVVFHLGDGGGYYDGGVGSSHKGGHYVNPDTGDHYRSRN